MAGPERPPVTFEMRGVRVSTSIAIPTNVLTRVSPSAPAASATRASTVMSVTFGESFTNNGKRAAFFEAETTSSVRFRSEEHTSELQSRLHLVCRLLLEKKKTVRVLHLH